MKRNFGMMVMIVLMMLLFWCGVEAKAHQNDTSRTPYDSMNPFPDLNPIPKSKSKPKAHPDPKPNPDPNPNPNPWPPDPLDNSNSKSGLIIGCVVAAVLTAVGLMALLRLGVTWRFKSAVHRDFATFQSGFRHPFVHPETICEKKIEPRKHERWKNVHPSHAFLTSMINDRSINWICLLPVEKIITTVGGVITMDNFTLKIGPGCLAKDTKITLRKDNQYIATNCKSLLDLGLLHAVPQVIRFYPAGLKFLKPAGLTITFESMADCDSEIFIVHGCYNLHHQTTVWQLVTNGIEQNSLEGIVNVKMNSFSFYSYISAKRGMLARILSHLNHSFICRAYAFYRRVPSSMDSADISIVLVSEFVDEDHREDIKQIKDHVEAGYVMKDKEFLKPVRTNCSLEMCLNFPDVESSPFLFKIDQGQLDSAVGFVIDHFKGIAIKSPANGAVRINEVQEEAKNELLWLLNISESGQEFKTEMAEVQHLPPEEVVHRTTKLTSKEICQIGRSLGIDWEKLAGLMDIPYSEQEEIRGSYNIYHSLSSKAKRVFELYNASKHFDRRVLVKYLEELGRHDLKKKMLPIKDEGGNEEVEQEKVHLQNNTPLSCREMCRLSQRLVVAWDTLAALLGISTAERHDIHYSLLYNTSHSRAEKILAIFNNMEDFSRQKLAECLEEIGQVELKGPVITGEWRR